MLESAYQAELIKEIHNRFPGSMVLKNDTDYQQGIPDLLVLFPGGGWAMLEVKRSAKEKFQPNQEYYVDLFNEMCFGATIYPENEQEVLDALQQTFCSRRSSRVSKR